MTLQHCTAHIAKGYLDAIAFTESDIDLFEDHTHIEADKKAVLNATCIAGHFYNNNSELVDNYASVLVSKGAVENLDNAFQRIGHELWLTSQRHSSGFWDNGYHEGLEKQLTEISVRYEYDVEVDVGESDGEFTLHLQPDKIK